MCPLQAQFGIFLCYLGIWSYISLSANQSSRDDYHNRAYRIGLLVAP